MLMNNKVLIKIMKIKFQKIKNQINKFNQA